MSRPATFGTPATDAIRVRVTPEQKRELKQLAKENQTNIASVIREAVNAYAADCRDRPPGFVVQNSRPGV